MVFDLAIVIKFLFSILDNNNNDPNHFIES